jgi:hypothetical protein
VAWTPSQSTSSSPPTIPILFSSLLLPAQHTISSTNQHSSLTMWPCASSLHVPHHATREWCKTHPTTRFGQTYHTMTPQQWALQSLSLNISHALGKYLQGALTDLSNAKSIPTHTSRITFYRYGPTRPSRFARTPPCLLPQPHTGYTHVPRTPTLA